MVKRCPLLKEENYRAGICLREHCELGWDTLGEQCITKTIADNLRKLKTEMRRR